MELLSGKVALVTGAASGMGAACARRMVEEGARVYVADVARDPLAAVAAELGAPCRALHLDVSTEADWNAAIAAITADSGRLDVLVNNAGILRRTPLEGTGTDLWEMVIRVNQLGVFLGMRAAAEVMREARSGSIVNVSSIDGMLGMPRLGAYVASKWAVRGMTKAAALELGPVGIRVNSIHPGYIDTPMLTVGGRMTEETKDRLAGQVPLGTLGAPEDIAAACVFLASEESRYCNGAELVVDGGLISGLKPS
ncbi:MAG: SDR family NAD(P)-dependent oxidoreductase [Solirubrobacteraceae bacterium]